MKIGEKFKELLVNSVIIDQDYHTNLNINKATKDCTMFHLEEEVKLLNDLINNNNFNYIESVLETKEIELKQLKNERTNK